MAYELCFNICSVLINHWHLRIRESNSLRRIPIHIHWMGASWSYGSSIYNCLCNQCLSTTNVVSSNPAHSELFSIQHYVIKFVSDLRQVGGFLWVLQFLYRVETCKLLLAYKIVWIWTRKSWNKEKEMK